MAYYGGMGGMGGMYPGMMGGMGGMGPMGGMGMYPGMMGGMGMTPMMGGGYGMPRYPTGGLYSMGYGGMMGGYPGMGIDPYMNFGAPPAANWVDDFADAHRIEHAYRQSAPDNYGVGLGMMGGIGGGMGINNMPGSQMLLYGRGMYPVGRDHECLTKLMSRDGINSRGSDENVRLSQVDGAERNRSGGGVV